MELDGRAQFSDADIQHYAAAASQVTKISQACLVRIEKTTSKKEERAIQESAMAEVEAIICECGLTRDLYNQISLAMRSDSSLTDRVDSLIGSA